jgi:hypothetical protein
VINSGFTILNSEESLLSPLWSPTVLANPIRLRVIVTDTTDTMTTYSFSIHVMVDSTSIGEEVIVDAKTCDDWTSRGNPFLHFVVGYEFFP